MGHDTVEEPAVTAAKQGRPQGWGPAFNEQEILREVRLWTT